MRQSQRRKKGRDANMGVTKQNGTQTRSDDAHSSNNFKKYTRLQIQMKGRIQDC